MIKIGVIGAGHLGKIHIRLLKEIQEFEFVGFYDSNDENAQKIASEFDIKSFQSAEELIEICDTIDIVTPTKFHFEYAKLVLEKGKHLFVEKPITSTLSEAEELIKLSNGKNLKIQVGHVERFNPAFTAIENDCKNPMFIEANRLAEFNPRGADIPVIHDLMIHDIDIILKIVNSKVKQVNASGVSIISDTPDIANARIDEIIDIIMNKNINIQYFKKDSLKVYIIIQDKIISDNFKETFKSYFLKNGNIDFNLINEFEIDAIITNTARLSAYGWNKEAIPISQIKNSIITRIFKFIFG